MGRGTADQSDKRFHLQERRAVGALAALRGWHSVSIRTWGWISWEKWLHLFNEFTWGACIARKGQAPSPSKTPAAPCRWTRLGVFGMAAPGVWLYELGSWLVTSGQPSAACSIGCCLEPYHFFPSSPAHIFSSPPAISYTFLTIWLAGSTSAPSIFSLTNNACTQGEEREEGRKKEVLICSKYGDRRRGDSSMLTGWNSAHAVLRAEAESKEPLGSSCILWALSKYPMFCKKTHLFCSYSCLEMSC